MRSVFADLKADPYALLLAIWYLSVARGARLTAWGLAMIPVLAVLRSGAGWAAPRLLSCNFLRLMFLAGYAPDVVNRVLPEVPSRAICAEAAER